MDFPFEVSWRQRLNSPNPFFLSDITQWGDGMAKKRLRFDISLDPELEKKLNDYILAVSNKQRKIVYDIKAKIGRMALKEWLEKHGKDYDIKFD